MPRGALEEIDPTHLPSEPVRDVDPVDNLANRNRNVLVTPNLDEEVIRKRGRKQKQNLITRKINPVILATMKSPVKRVNRSSNDIVSIFDKYQTPSGSRTPSKRQKTASSTPLGVSTRRRLNLTTNDSGIGESPSRSPTSSPTNDSLRTPSTSKRKSLRQLTSERRRTRSHNLRRLSSSSMS